MYNLLSFFSHTAERHTQTKESVGLRLKRDDGIKDERMCLCQAVAVNISVYEYTQMSTAETH